MASTRSRTARRCLLSALLRSKAAGPRPASLGRNLPCSFVPMQSIRERHHNGSLSSMLRVACRSVVPKPSVKR